MYYWGANIICLSCRVLVWCAVTDSVCYVLCVLSCVSLYVICFVLPPPPPLERHSKGLRGTSQEVGSTGRFRNSRGQLPDHHNPLPRKVVQALLCNMVWRSGCLQVLFTCFQVPAPVVW